MKTNNIKYRSLFLMGCVLYIGSGCAAPHSGQKPAASHLTQQNNCVAVETESILDAEGYINFADAAFKQYALAAIAGGVYKITDNQRKVHSDEAAALKSLNLFHHDRLGLITNLSDIRHFTGLKEIMARNQQFVCADLSACQALEKVDICENSALVSITLPPEASINSLTLRKCPALTQLNFLPSHAPSLSVLDLYDCTAYRNPIDLSAMNKLRLLNLGGVPVSSLDLRKNSLLKFLCLIRMSGNPKVLYTPNQESLRLQCYSDESVRWVEVSEVLFALTAS